MMWLIVANFAVCVLAPISWAIIVTAGLTTSFCADWLSFRQARIRAPQ